MSLQAYKTATARAENPREASISARVTWPNRRYSASRADPTDIKTRIDALDWNRRLWSTLATDCSNPDNTLPAPLRAQLISISLFVSRHSSAVMRREEDFEPLIDINKMIMQGLAPTSGAQAA